MHHIPDLPVLRRLAVNLLLPLRLPSCSLFHPLLLPKVALRHTDICITKEPALTLRHLPLVSVSLAITLIGLQEITEKHLVEVEVIEDLDVLLLVHVFRRSAKHSVGVSLHLRLLDDASLTLFVGHERFHPRHDSCVKHSFLVLLACLLEVAKKLRPAIPLFYRLFDERNALVEVCLDRAPQLVRWNLCSIWL